MAFVAGVADASGYGWAIAKQLANAGATIVVGTWPPMLTLFERGLNKGFGEDGLLLDGTPMKIDKIYPLDAMFSNPSEVPDEIKANKRSLPPLPSIARHPSLPPSLSPPPFVSLPLSLLPSLSLLLSLPLPLDLECSLPPSESGPPRAVHLSHHKWLGGLVN